MCAEISQHVIHLFVGLCHLHKQQASVTHPTKKPITSSIQANSYQCHIQLDLMDFRNLECSCGQKHKWVLHVTNHYRKFSWLGAPTQKKYCSQLKSYSGYLVSQPCYIPTMGENLKIKKWQHLWITQNEPCSWCSSNITNPGFGRKRQPNCETECLQYHQRKKSWWNKMVQFRWGSSLQKEYTCAPGHIEEPIWTSIWHTTPTPNYQPHSNSYGNNSFMYSDSSSRSHESGRCHCRRWQVKKSSEEEASSSSHKRKAPEDDLVQWKATRIATNEKQIYPVDKTSPLHPNLLIGKVISVESYNYITIATKFGKISTLISPARLLKCSKPNMQFNTTKDIPCNIHKSLQNDSQSINHIEHYWTDLQFNVSQKDWYLLKDYCISLKQCIPNNVFDMESHPNPNSTPNFKQ